jgi:hypothetical protein
MIRLDYDVVERNRCAVPEIRKLEYCLIQLQPLGEGRFPKCNAELYIALRRSEYGAGTD